MQDDCGAKHIEHKLLPEVREEIVFLLNANIAPMKIADYVHIKTGQRLTTKDINVIQINMVRDQPTYNKIKQETILQRIKQFIIFSSDILEKRLLEDSRNESDIESITTNGSSLISMESVWAHVSEDENGCIQNNSVFFQTAVQRQSLATLIDKSNNNMTSDFHDSSVQLPAHDPKKYGNSTIYNNHTIDDDQTIDFVVRSIDDACESIEMLESEGVEINEDNSNFEASHNKCLASKLLTNNKIVINHAMRKTNIANDQKEFGRKLKNTKCRILSCPMCGTDSRMLEAQLDVLRARKLKLKHEIKILKLKQNVLKISKRTNMSD